VRLHHAIFLIGMLLMTAANAAETRIHGLSGPVDIVTDRYGIPHINATTVDDAFFGQGYAVASQRLWQMDLSRRRGLGLLAEAFGPSMLKYDEAARTLLFRGDLAAEWASLDARVASGLRAFTAGVNARIGEVLADPALLPPEFARDGVRPSLWQDDDLLRARYAGAQNAPNEMRRARLACAGLLDADGLTARLEPAWTTVLPEGLDPCLLKPGDLELLERRTAALPFESATQFAEAGQPEINNSEGSNAWVISPKLSATGRAILANDPHLSFSVPGPRFITHLKAPGLDAIGAGPAGRPGFQFGHTDRIAFGRTDFKIDQEDLYVLELNANATAYRTKSGWQKITRVAESIKVRGAADVVLSVGLTPLGPIIAERPGHAVALRAASMLPGSPVGLEFMLVVLSTDWASYRHAISRAVWGSNYFYADVEGNIGWQTGGRAPRRRNHDGLLPVPAAGDYDWDGLIPIDELPFEFNPPRGWIASGNQMPFPPDYPINERRVNFEWTMDDRYRRIAAVLGSQTIHSLADSVALQRDTYSMRFEALRPLLSHITAPDLAPAVAALAAWNGHVDADSHPAALYEFWSAFLQSLLAETLIPPGAHGIITSIHPHVARDILLSPDSRLGPDPIAARDAIITEALHRAVKDVGARDWGTIHTVNLRHAMPHVRDGDVTGLSSGGDGTTVMARWWAGVNNPNTSGGAMFAAVVDVGNWDASLAINAPGQSGNPSDPHYRDLYARWLAGDYFALPFSNAAMRAASGQ
jgi:penicillin amidase